MADLSIDTDYEKPPSDFLEEIESRQQITRGSEEGFDEFGRSLELLKWQPIDFLSLNQAQREACHELFRRGDVSWFLHPEQQKLLNWIDAKHREIATICISRQFGKTTMLLAWAIAYCLARPKASVLFVAPHRQQVITILQPKLNLVFQFIPEDVLPTKSGNIWTFPNGSQFRIDGVAIGKGTKLRGDSVHLCIMDECRDMPELQEMIESVIAPMLSTTDGRLVLISTPPHSPLHSFTKKYIADCLTRGDFYSATYKQNPLVSTKRLRYLIEVQHPGGEENPVFRREWMADWSITDPEKRVVREWDEATNDKFFEDYPGPPAVVRPYIGLDYAFSDPAGIIAGYYDFNCGCFIIVDEWFERGKNSDEVGSQIMEMERKLKVEIPGALEPIRVMDIDPGLMADLWGRFNLRFEPAMKVPSTITMLNRLRVAINEGKLRIRRNCTQLRFQLKAGVFNASGSDYMRTRDGGHLDLIDATKYVILNMRWHEAPFGRPKEQAVGPNQMRIGGFMPTGSFRDGVIQRPR
jgi:hypothetical protein